MYKEQLTSNEAVCYYFKGMQCTVCTVLEPKVKKIIQTHFPKITYRCIEPNESPELSNRLRVFSAPTIVVMFDGKEIIRKGRNISIPEFEHELSRYYDLFFS